MLLLHAISTQDRRLVVARSLPKTAGLGIRLSQYLPGGVGWPSEPRFGCQEVRGDAFYLLARARHDKGVYPCQLESKLID